MRNVAVGVISGMLFGFLDGLINGNPFAQKLFKIYEPIAKKSINMPVGLVIDLIYGLVMAWLFLLISKSLPGSTGLAKGLSFGLMIWFFRVVMSTASNWMIFKLPPQVHAYTLSTGLLEMLVIGAFYGVLLKP